MSRRQCKTAGFTLVEMLVAVTLSSVVMLALFAMFSGVVDVAAHVRTRGEVAHGQTTFEAILFNDLHSMCAGQGEDFRFVGRGGSFLGDDGEFLEFCTSASLSVVGISASLSMNRVAYSLKDSENGKTVFRSERPYCGVAGEWGSVEVPVLENVSELELEYLDSFDNTFVSEWDGSAGTYPQAVAVTVTHVKKNEYFFVVESSLAAIGQGAGQ